MTEPTPPLAGRREWIGLAVTAPPCLLYSMTLTVLNLAVPAISADLRPSRLASDRFQPTGILAGPHREGEKP